MEIEDQLVSFDLAREMEELGVKQDSLWVWMKPPRTGLPEVVLRKTMILLEDQGWKYISAAPTVAELGETLPTDYVTGKLALDEENAQKWACIYLSIPEFEPWLDRLEFGDTEADTRAKMVIYLIKEGIIKVEDLK